MKGEDCWNMLKFQKNCLTSEDDVPNPDKTGQTKIQRKHMQIRGLPDVTNLATGLAEGYITCVLYFCLPSAGRISGTPLFSSYINFKGN